MKLFFGSGTNRPVRICTDVRDYLPKEKRYQYEDGYSMAESAKCWVAAYDHLPQSIAEIVGSDELVTAHFEYPTRVWGNGTSMTDIMAFVPAGVVAVEAKVNEPFGEFVSEWISEKGADDSLRRTGVIEKYAKALGVSWTKLLDIRYQLLHRMLSAARTARYRGAARAWMIVHSFAPVDESDSYVRNRGDFDRFVALAGATPKIEGMQVQLSWATDTPTRLCTKDQVEDHDRSDEECVDDVDRALNGMGRFYRHNAMHAGAVPMVLDEFGRCAKCVKLGFWKPNA
jgi:hypothetical protein